MTSPWSCACCQIARSEPPASPRLLTWVQSGYRSASSAASRAARFSSKSSICCSGGWYAHHPALALGGKGQTGADVNTRQLREIGQNLLLAHAGSKVREHIADGNARAPYTGLPEPNFWVYDDPIAVIHWCNDRRTAPSRQGLAC